MRKRRARGPLAGNVPCARPESLTGKIVVVVDEDVRSARLGFFDLDDRYAGSTVQRHASGEKPDSLHGSISCSRGTRSPTVS